MPEVKETGDKEAIAYIDDLLQNDPMHQWLSRPTAELKQDIKSGKMQKIYSKMFESEPGSK